MAMYGIDISEWNASLDLKSTGAELVIVKATDGIRFVDDCCDRKVQEAKANGQLFGFYHFANGLHKSSMKAQADYFVDNCANYFNDGVPFLDWEDSDEKYGGEVLKYGPGAAKEFLDRVYERTGVRPIIYMNASAACEYDWSEVAKDYALWGAAYGNGGFTYDNPGTSRYSWGAFGAPAIHQYSSSNGLDKDIAYLTRDAWAKFAAGSGDAKATEQPDPATEQPSDVTYVVKSGDNLSAIAEMFGTTWEHLADINGIVNPNLIHPGDVLKVSGSAPAPAPAPQASGRTYTVKSGDNLSAIAQVFGTSWKHLAEINHLANPNLIHPGDVLAIDGDGAASAPAAQTYTVVSGDNLSAIAQRFGTSWRHLADINHLDDPNLVHPGQVLVIG